MFVPSLMSFLGTSSTVRVFNHILPRDSRYEPDAAFLERQLSAVRIRMPFLYIRSGLTTFLRYFRNENIVLSVPSFFFGRRN